ncbi:MAG: hypothetical protein QOJ00_2897 [Actinomycetota bacterium]
MAALGGAGVMTVLNAGGGSNLPVLNIATAAPNDTTTTVVKPTSPDGAAGDKAVCDHDGPGPRDRAPLDDATAAKVQAAAIAAVPNATVDKAGHDRGDGYVAMLTKADGTTRVLVHEDANFKVTDVQDPAPMRGDHGPGGRGDHGANDGDADDAGATPPTTTASS